MFGAYVKENRKALIALAVYTVVFARSCSGSTGCRWVRRGTRHLCLFLLLALWFAVDYRRFCRAPAAAAAAGAGDHAQHRAAAGAGRDARGAVSGARARARRRPARADDAQPAQLSGSGEYYTVWAHQIKTPLAAMRLLLQDAETDEQHALLEQLQSVEQYVEMVLGYLRLESPSSDYVIRNYVLDDIVRQAVRKFASQFIRRKLRLEYAPLNVNVITNEKWLLFVIEQVLSNALKYTRSGSVSITLEEPKTLCIRDTGIGIAPEDLPRI